MWSSVFARRTSGALTKAVLAIALPFGAQAATKPCNKPLADAIPKRTFSAPSGSELMQSLMKTGGAQRDAAVADHVLSGNIPSFLRDLAPVTIEGRNATGEEVKVTICVTPEYLSVGHDRDFVRVPMGLPAAVRIAEELGFLLPTTKMVDAIYSQAKVRLAPSPMKPTSQMESTAYLVQHDATVDKQSEAHAPGIGQLTAGQKKDLVLSNRLRAKPGRVAIYGWHRTNGKPIQPLSTVHGARYADYSHGVRLVSQTAFVDGKPVSLKDIIQDRNLASVVSSEGPIRDLNGLVKSLYKN